MPSLSGLLCIPALFFVAIIHSLSLSFCLSLWSAQGKTQNYQLCRHSGGQENIYTDFVSRRGRCDTHNDPVALSHTRQLYHEDLSITLLPWKASTNTPMQIHTHILDTHSQAQKGGSRDGESANFAVGREVFVAVVIGGPGALTCYQSTQIIAFATEYSGIQLNIKM